MRMLSAITPSLFKIIPDRNPNASDFPPDTSFVAVNIAAAIPPAIGMPDLSITDVFVSLSFACPKPTDRAKNENSIVKISVGAEPSFKSRTLSKNSILSRLTQT